MSSILEVDTISIAARIARAKPSLTRSHQQMAEYVLRHPLQAATMPIDELAAAVGVSVATANRFARAIGLSGYPMLRAELVKGFEAMLAPVEKMRARLQQPGSVFDAFLAALDENQRNIAATRAALQAQECEAAVQAIVQAHRVYVLGFGASGWLAGLLQRGLETYCENVHLMSSVGGASQGARQLPRMGARDLVIAIAFPRYLSDTVLLAQAAHERGVGVLALTDGPHSPLVPVAHHCLYAHAESYHAANSESTVLALIEALCSAVALRRRGSVQDAARVTEAVLPWLHDSARASLRVRAPAANVSE
ncbi:transcriptional regulator, RpiR family [Oryzisolibacter propanilivorax]|uniref:Transcriptional regulator, RpiR family n=1 Tax=Oryzisolibacter propanilivorax TaxID=1527607 RepID=A0A1G9QM67_9BURK|nr:MurR/RpiR family transcriptional regulator [Oryzisolibacter propanilivorax]SDM12112.1 transcriptional regulator, RpiR family [Oryzisolibacter propanilivorax]